MASKAPRKSPVTKVPASPTDHPLDDELLDRFRPQRPGLVRDYVSRTTLEDVDTESTFP